MRRLRKLCCATLALGLMLPVVTFGSGSGAEAAAGTWKHNSKGWWYSYSDGKYAKNEWVKYGGSWYYFKNDGYMATGWVQYDGKWYYFGKNGAMTTGWKKIDGKWYFFRNNGSAFKGWKEVDGEWYYLGSNYAMTTGWRKIKENWYHFAGSGAMTIGWLDWKDNTYYFNEEGQMVTGSVVIDGYEYTFDDDGALVGGSSESGTWTDPAAKTLTDDELQIFADAIDSHGGYSGSDFEPMACLGEQLVAGMNHRFLAKWYYETGYFKYVIVTTYTNLENQSGVTGIEVSPLEVSTETLSGGYTEPESIFFGSDSTSLKALAAFGEVTNDLTGADYKPLALLGTSIVSGTNYRILCYGKSVTPGAKGFFTVITINVPLEGDPTIVDFDDFVPDAAG